MLLPLYVSCVVAVLFYFFLPMFSALRHGAYWHSYRTRMISLAGAALLDYASAAEARKAGGGVWRIQGEVEALEGSDRLWLRSSGLSVVVDFSSSPILVMARRSPGLAMDSIDRAGSVQTLRWRQVRSIPEGARLFVAGRLSFDGGTPVFRDDPEQPLFVLLHDEEEADLLPAFIAGARSRNNFWGRPTFLIWAIGIATSSLFSIWTGGIETLASIRFLSWVVALSPIIPFLPPGMVFLVFARRLWLRGLVSRMRRDLAEAEGRACTESASPDGVTLLALGAAALAYAVNFLLAVVAWRLLA